MLLLLLIESKSVAKRKLSQKYVHFIVVNAHFKEKNMFSLILTADLYLNSWHSYFSDVFHFFVSFYVPYFLSCGSPHKSKLPV